MGSDSGLDTAWLTFGGWSYHPEIVMTLESNEHKVTTYLLNR